MSSVDALIFIHSIVFFVVFLFSLVLSRFQEKPIT